MAVRLGTGKLWCSRLSKTFSPSHRLFSYQSVTESVQKALTSIVGEENFSSSTAVREQHGKDESYHQSLLPDVVLFPTALGQVQEIAK